MRLISRARVAGIAGDVDHPGNFLSDESVQQGGTGALAGRVQHRRLGRRLLPQQLGQSLSRVGTEELARSARPLRRALARASSTAWGTTSTPRACPARWARHKVMVPAPQ